MPHLDDQTKESSDRGFITDVIEASHTQPVLVQFWAPWSKGSRELTPILEQVVRAANGKVALVRINIDDNPEFAGRLSVREVPTVFAFDQGRPVDGFIGAVSEGAVRSCVDRLVTSGPTNKSEAEITTAQATVDALGGKGRPNAPLFISHASQADGARARALVKALEAAGQPCWIAPRDIAAGADWNGAILAAIETCGGVVLLVSPASVASPFVKAEIQHAFEHKKRVVPVRLAEAQPSLLDLRLKTVQHIEADGDFSLVVRAITTIG